MSFTRWGYTLEGAWDDPNNLEDKAGVYVIWCKSEESWKVLDVGESHKVKERVLNHDRSECWESNCRGTIYYSVIYTPFAQQAGRMEIEQRIRGLVNPPCGEK